MTKLEQLINELCPDGVKYKSLNECVDIMRGTRVVKNNLSEDGKYPVYQNSLTPMGYHIESNASKDTTFIIVAGAAGEIGYSTVDFWAADDCFCLKCHQEITSRFLYHLLLQQQSYIYSKVRKASIPRLSRTVVEKITIPVPPLPVQAEIVRILDKFTQLEAELEAQLQSELEARRKQYEHYRDVLLSFDMNGGGTTNCEWKKIKLGDVGKISMCKRIMKSETSANGDVPFYKIGTFGGEPNAYISRATFEKYNSLYSFPKKGDILISAAGTIGRAVVYNGEPAYYQDSNIVWIDNDETMVLNRYLYYVYQLSPWQISTGGTIARLYNDNIANAKINIPPLQEQEHIVSILDRFDALCNDITQGLPAEIDARRKQYEYYRDKLLTFQPLA